MRLLSNAEKTTPRIGAGAVLVLVPIFLHLLPATYLEGYDYTAMHRFYREYLRNSVLAGEFPWWNPYTALGRPFFADIETASAYPFTYLVFPLGVQGGVIAGVILHCWLGLWATQRLARALGATDSWSWLAGLTFVLSGPVLARLQLGQLGVFAALCWVPAFLVAGIRLQDTPSIRAMLAWVIAEAGCFLAGSPNMLWIGNIGFACLLLVRASPSRTSFRLVGWLSAGVLLTAGLVAVQALPFIELVQAGNRPVHDISYATRFGMPPTTWLSIVLPAMPAFPFTPEFNQYIGAVILISGGVFILKNLRTQNARALLALAICGLILSAGDRLKILGFLANHLPGFGAMRYPSRYGFLTVLALILAGTVGLSRLDQAGRPLLARSLGAVQLVLILWAAFCAASLYRLPAAKHWDAELQEDLQLHGLYFPNHVPPRIAFDAGKVSPNSGMVRRYSTFDGFSNPMLRNVWMAMHQEAGVAPPDFELHEFNPSMYDHGPFPVASAALNAGWDPLASATIIRPSTQTPPRAQLLAITENSPVAGAASIRSFARNDIVVQATSALDARLVLAEPAYPGWRATVNEREASVFESNGWMRSVSIPPGDSRVHFWYLPRHLFIGLLVSLGSAGVMLGFWYRSRGVSRCRPQS